MRLEPQRLVNISFFTILIPDILDYVAGEEAISYNPVYVNAGLRFICLCCLVAYSRKVLWKKQIPKGASNLLAWFFIWNIIIVIKGIKNAGGYYDWRFLLLSSFFNFCIPLAVIIGIMVLQNAQLFKVIIKKVFVFVLPLVTLNAIQVFAYARATISVWMFVLMGAYIKNKWRILILFTAFLALITGYEIRANFLRIAVALALFFFFQFRRAIKTVWLKSVCFVLFLLPFIFLYLGITNIFNVFQPFDDGEEFVVNDGGKESSNLIADTRTGLYIEVFNSVLADKTLIFGGGATAKYKTEYFDLSDDATGRYGAEVGFLNTLLYSGIIGVVLYMLVLMYASYLALNKSNNFFCKMLALFLAFRWVLFFIEDLMKFDINFYFLWIAIGMCFSNQFRILTDSQIKMWISKYVLKG